MIQERDHVVLKVDLPGHALVAGDVGTVVDITGNDAEYTVEFLRLTGETFAIVPLLPSQVRPVRPTDMPRARQLSE